MSRKVCMFVYNNFLHDTRVLKEARTLVASGYDVTVVAVLDDASKPFEDQQGIKIVRMKIPIHIHNLPKSVSKMVRSFSYASLKFPQG